MYNLLSTKFVGRKYLFDRDVIDPLDPSMPWYIHLGLHIVKWALDTLLASTTLIACLLAMNNSRDR